MKPKRDLRYLAWIRTLPCVVCGANRGIEASHTGPHGLGQKSSYFSAIPLCYRHHRTGADSYHRLGPKKFSKMHDLNIPKIVGRLNTKPVIRIEAGAFVGYLESQQYRLGPTGEGIMPAVRKMIRLSAEDRWSTEIAS